eukprot:CAMPEP_0194513522 /NCGR_PEP_ID=MMETSP0253-20130528/45831_1 /TAXON_ID=2966 /ORGANISM="Noctiluca scintillans" /LENGTH=41 /DNA_ID= /DNA_START= /DNA_END= /DNA_ORIENTATION=
MKQLVGLDRQQKDGATWRNIKRARASFQGCQKHDVTRRRMD